ncbi:MAG: hypothetical protein AB1403_24185 [Candidatus Riflebacteria bacterium]
MTINDKEPAAEVSMTIEAVVFSNAATQKRLEYELSARFFFLCFAGSTRPRTSTSGTVIDWVMKAEKLTFREAAEYLQKLSNLETVKQAGILMTRSLETNECKI